MIEDLLSALAARNFIQGKPNTLLPLIGTIVARSVMVGVGFYVAGERKNIIKYSVASTFAIESFVLFWEKLELNKHERTL